MFESFTNEQIRGACKARLENLERWLRRLVDDQLSQQSSDYFNSQDEKGNRYIKTSIANDARNRTDERGAERYPRLIDAVLLEELVQIICARWIDFEDALVAAFPNGREEARTFLRRLVGPRNKLSHANDLSMREAEQVICYTGDTIASLKEYYNVLGKNADYNVPTIFRFTDSFGNTRERSQLRSVQGELHESFHQKAPFVLYPGDEFWVEVEIDPSFPSSEYEVIWWGNSVTRLQTSRRALTITSQHVGEQWRLFCDVVSNKDWHRLNGCDDRLCLIYKVLPPI